MDNKYIEPIKCPLCSTFKLIEDFEIMRVYPQGMIIRSKCDNCGYAQRSQYNKTWSVTE